jgi:DNA-binding IclR family transcriptional regulator
MSITTEVFNADAAVNRRLEQAASAATAGAGLALLAKGFAIMEAVAQAKRPPSLSEISRQTGLPTSTVHRILGALCGYGVVDREEDSYLPGWRSAHLFDPRLAPHWQALRDHALPSMLNLHGALGCSVSLIAPTRRAAVVLLQLRVAGDRGSPGAHVTEASPHYLVAGGLLDAYRSEQVDLVRPLSDDAGGQDVERARVRSAGHLRVRPADRPRPITSLAVPVFDRARQVLAALTICGRWSSEDDELVLHRLRQASSATTRALRADPATAPPACPYPVKPDWDTRSRFPVA